MVKSRRKKRPNGIYGGDSVITGTAPYIDKRGYGYSYTSDVYVAECSTRNSDCGGGMLAGKVRGISSLTEEQFILASGLDPDENLRLNSLSIGQVQCCSLKISAPDVRYRWYLSAEVHSKRGDFLYDPGANSSMLSNEFYDTLSPKPPVVPSGVEVIVANGGTM